MSTNIEWSIPQQYASDPQWDKINIYGSQSTTDIFTLLSTELSGITNCPPAFVTSYTDNSVQNPWPYYGVKLFNSTSNTLSHFIIATKEPTYTELVLITQLRAMMGPILSTDPTTSMQFTDGELLSGIYLGLCAFNIYPPVTDFTLDTIPHCYLVVVLYLAQLYTFINRYLGMALNDFTYSDNGLSLNIDRGARVNTAIQNVQKVISDMLAITKLEFAFQGDSVGTLQLPIGIGGVISRGVSNLLDVFNSFGR